jgi:hypothetical protein
MLFTQAAKLEPRFCSGDYRPFLATPKLRFPCSFVKRNGTSWIKQASQSFWNISSGPPQAALREAPLGATLEGPLEVALPPETAQLILQSTYMKSMRQNTLLTVIRCPLVKRLTTIK